MINADRLMRIMYKELDFNLFALNKLDTENKSVAENGMKQFSMFDLKNDQFIKILKNKYLEVYPDNYNMDEVNIIIEEQKQNIQNKFGQTNTLFLFPFYAEKLFKFVNSHIRVDFNDILEWDGFINKVDGNIFIAAFLASNNINSNAYQPDEIISHTNNRLYKILDKGVAENHMHLKASGYTSDLNWVTLLGHKIFDTEALTKFVSNENNFGKLKTSGKKNEDIILYIQKIKLVRIYLMQFIDVYKSDNKYFLEEKKKEYTDYCISEKEMYRMLVVNTSVELEVFREKIQKVERIRRHNFRINTADIKQSYLIERKFLTELFTILLNNEFTRFFMYLFNFYLAGLNLIKFEFVQDNIGMGFGKFKEKESVKEGFLNNNLLIYESVFDKYYKEGNIKKIEIRIAPKSKKDLIKLIDTLNKTNEKYYRKYKAKNEAISKIEYGIIIHYIKNSDSLNNGDNISMWRNKKMRVSLDRESKKTSSFFSLSAASHLYKIKIIGIDAANVELRCRPEVFGPVFRKHRLESKKSNNLNFTYHVGEEFNTICNGLRAIDEVVEFLNFRRNDRLGHALALGMEIKTYFTKKRNFLTSTLQDYVDDIIWMYYLVASENSVDYHSNMLLYLAEEFEKYSKKLFCNTKLCFEFSMYDYMCAYQLRGDNPSEYKVSEVFECRKMMIYENIMKKPNKKYQLNSDNKKHQEAFMNKKAQKLYYLYHNNLLLRQQGQQTEIFEVQSYYIEAVELAQNLLQKKIYEKGISVEVNPSSNRKISSITKFIDLPAFGINRVGLKKESLKDLDYHIPVSINTDDSSIFQTNLNNEYSMLAAALFRYGFANEDVYQYIEYLRKSSLEQSFIREVPF
ncbi:Adenosine/AMP deaminase [Carnobacterium iners]|uniref:Adenosine/AMP deaminase n=1 Tax=Carnobacterium iners TaxID=1073423 RepID=A0A1X7N8T8_9LACT|nr:hypothetical protein [Carnobacterium iners]SEL07840.1 Adenosine/AMP deaminase [Carnobacterium iners]SMH33996.1 Adenosine/AMP deaminase [Carnobacterium iners]